MTRLHSSVALFRVDDGEAKRLIKRLKRLEGKAARKIARKAVRAGGNVVKKAVLAEVPRRSGRLAKAVKVRAAGNRPRGLIAVDVSAGKWEKVAGRGEKASKEAQLATGYYSTWVEYGHRMKNVFKKGRFRAVKLARRGRPGYNGPGIITTKPNPFFQRALERTKESAPRVTMETLKRLIESEASK